MNHTIYQLSVQGKAKLSELEARDRRNECECPMPFTFRKFNAFLGTWANIRLCCLAKAVERLTGERFYFHEEFEPTDEWDYKRDNIPPDYVLVRMERKGIRVKNVPTG